MPFWRAPRSLRRDGVRVGRARRTRRRSARARARRRRRAGRPSSCCPGAHRDDGAHALNAAARARSHGGRSRASMLWPSVFDCPARMKVGTQESKTLCVICTAAAGSQLDEKNLHCSHLAHVTPCGVGRHRKLSVRDCIRRRAPAPIVRLPTPPRSPHAPAHAPADLATLQPCYPSTPLRSRSRAPPCRP